MVSLCRRSRSAVLIAAGLIQAVLFTGMVAVPAAAKEPIVEYRQSVMQAIGGHTGALAKIIPGKATFSDDAKAHVLALAALAKMATRSSRPRRPPSPVQHPTAPMGILNPHPAPSAPVRRNNGRPAHPALAGGPGAGLCVWRIR